MFPNFLLFCNYVSQKTLSIALEPLQMARQLFSIDKWFVPRKTVTFCFMVATVACLLGAFTEAEWENLTV